MYECLDCGAEFETLSIADGDDENDFEVCPYCGSDDIVEVDDADGNPDTDDYADPENPYYDPNYGDDY